MHSAPRTSPRRRLVGVLASILLVAGLAGCVPWWAPGRAGPDRTDDGGSREASAGGTRVVECAPGEPVVLDVPAADYVLEGECGDVSVRGDQIDVGLASAATLTIEGQISAVVVDGALGTMIIRGDGNRVEAGRIATVTVNGQENTIEADAVDESLSVQGDRNAVEAEVPVDRQSVNGQDNRIGPAAD